jgi:hypothetical protein
LLQRHRQAVIRVGQGLLQWYEGVGHPQSIKPD